MPFNKTVDQLVTEQAHNLPTSVAIKFDAQSISYQSLDQRVNQFSNLLIANGINIGDRVALAVNRSIEMVVAILAISRIGGVYIPLDPTLPAERLAFMLADSAAKLLLTNTAHNHHFPASNTKLFIEDAWAHLDDYSIDAPALEIKGNNIAYILYTSGSTGKPKGVQIERDSLLNLLLSIQKEPGLSANDTWLALATISFDISILEIWLPLITGSKLIICNSDTAKDGSLILATIKAENVTVMQATPYTWRMMLVSGWDSKLPLKAITGGEALPRDLADKLLNKCDSLWNYYGPTETTIYSTGKQILATDTLITIGKPIANTEAYILDENLNPVPNGTEGELCVGGAGVAYGYLNRPDITAEKFIGDKPGKLYRTGDLARILENGEIQYLGRIDRQVKIRGYRIETEEIEYNLVKQSGIQSAVVTVHTDQLGNQRLVAYLVTGKNEQTDSHQLIERLKLNLPDYMVPTDYVNIPEIPLNANGKIDYKLLPAPVPHAAGTEYHAPDSETEEMVASIWSKYLGIKNLGIDDNFFELGGHSLIAVQIMTKISKTTGKLFPIATLFRYPTIKKLASLIQSGGEDSTWKSLVAIKPSGSKMPLYIVHGVGLNILVFNSIASNVDTEQPIYGLQSRGLNGVGNVSDSVYDIAALYVQEIVEQNPTGPYAIAGYSIGGYIAVEMCKQLQQMGKEVKVLAMFDANFKYFNAQSQPLKRAVEIIQRQMRKSAFVVQSFIKKPMGTVSFLNYMIKTRVLSKFGLYKEIIHEDVPEYMQNIVDKLEFAVSRYKMTPYDGVIHLFMSSIRDYYVDDPKYLGWGKFALKGVQVHKVPGDHMNMLLPPNDKQFAKVLQACLDQYN